VVVAHFRGRAGAVSALIAGALAPTRLGIGEGLADGDGISRRDGVAGWLATEGSSPASQILTGLPPAPSPMK
jgi:hypothetical protein